MVMNELPPDARGAREFMRGVSEIVNRFLGREKEDERTGLLWEEIREHGLYEVYKIQRVVWSRNQDHRYPGGIRMVVLDDDSDTRGFVSRGRFTIRRDRGIQRPMVEVGEPGELPVIVLPFRRVRVETFIDQFPEDPLVHKKYHLDDYISEGASYELSGYYLGGFQE